MIKIGLLGGTFDPIHNGHLQLALAALKQCDLEKVYFIPAGSPPHKRFSNVSPFHDRFEMVKLVCQKYPGLNCLDIENQRTQPSYTIDTVNQLLSQHPQCEFYFIIGDDAFVEVETWKDYKKLLSKVSFLICGRETFDDQLVNKLLKSLGYVCEQEVWTHQSYKNIIKLDFLPPGISSTMIRIKSTDDLQLSDLIPNEVKNYIKKNNLYSL